MDLAKARESYLYAYPGDAYVDVLGIDNYMDAGATWNRKPRTVRKQELITGLTMLSSLAVEKKKMAALTETGLEGVTESDWFTAMMLQPLSETPGMRIAYLMVWRNANTTHHYAPYPGHPSAEDFKAFYRHPFTLFEGDLKDMYVQRK